MCLRSSQVFSQPGRLVQVIEEFSRLNNDFSPVPYFFMTVMLLLTTENSNSKFKKLGFFLFAALFVVR